MTYYKAKLNTVWIEQQYDKPEELFDAYEMLRLIEKDKR